MWSIISNIFSVLVIYATLLTVSGAQTVSINLGILFVAVLQSIVNNSSMLLLLRAFYVNLKITRKKNSFKPLEKGRLIKQIE